jgi:hypothetical protein
LDFAMGTMGDGEEGNHMTTQPTPTITWSYTSYTYESR